MFEFLQSAWAYALTHMPELREATLEHLALVLLSLFIATAVCVPLGVWTSRSAKSAQSVINFFNSVRVIPSIAVLFLLIPVFGLSFASAVVALILLAIPPIIVNTDAAYRSVDPAIKEAAVGMGMTSRQVLLRIETALALPVIIAGIRTATTEVMASATLAAFIGIGGLGTFIVRGLAMYDLGIMLVGAVPVILLTLLAELMLGLLERQLRPPHMSQ